MGRVHRRQAGLTFLDLLLVIVIVMLITVYAVMKMNTAGENTIAYQAQRLARDIRHVQVLAFTWGRPLQVTVTPGINGSYSVSCAATGVAPCDTYPSPIIDPVTGNEFTVMLQHDVDLAVASGGANPNVFDTVGRPLNGGSISTTPTTYTLTSGTTTISIAVAPITGHVSVTP